MASRVIPLDTQLRVPLTNGIGRYVCQLQRLTLTFCKERSDSNGMRDYIEGELVEFARHNPGIAIYLHPRLRRAPTIRGEFLNGKFQTTSCAKMSSADISKWVEFFRSRSGYDLVRVRKTQLTTHPSIQGIWSPFYSSGPSAPLEGPSDRAHLLPLPADVVRLASGTASAAAAASTSTSSVASSVSGRSQVASASAAVELESDGSWATWDATRSTLSDRVRQLMREQQAPTRTRAASASSDRTAAAASTSAKTAVSSRFLEINK